MNLREEVIDVYALFFSLDFFLIDFDLFDHGALDVLLHSLFNVLLLRFDHQILSLMLQYQLSHALSLVFRTISQGVHLCVLVDVELT